MTLPGHGPDNLEDVVRVERFKVRPFFLASLTGFLDDVIECFMAVLHSQNQAPIFFAPETAVPDDVRMTHPLQYRGLLLKPRVGL